VLVPKQNGVWYYPHREVVIGDSGAQGPSLFNIRLFGKGYPQWRKGSILMFPGLLSTLFVLIFVRALGVTLRNQSFESVHILVMLFLVRKRQDIYRLKVRIYGCG